MKSGRKGVHCCVLFREKLVHFFLGFLDAETMAALNFATSLLLLGVVWLVLAPILDGSVKIVRNDEDVDVDVDGEEYRTNFVDSSSDWYRRHDASNWWGLFGGSDGAAAFQPLRNEWWADDGYHDNYYYGWEAGKAMEKRKGRRVNSDSQLQRYVDNCYWLLCTRYLRPDATKECIRGQRTDIFGERGLSSCFCDCVPALKL